MVDQNSKQRLDKLCKQRGYTLHISSQSSPNTPAHLTTWSVTLSIEGISVYGEGQDKKLATNDAALKMLWSNIQSPNKRTLQLLFPVEGSPHTD